MRRSIESVIESWATKDASRPLLIRGARRVGKTYAAEEIGRRIAGDAFVKLDFQTDLELIAPLFDCPTDDVDTIVARISDYKRTPIRKETAFILFDEVQLCERGAQLASLFLGFGLAHMRDRQSARRRHAQAQAAFSQWRPPRDHASHVVRGVSLGARRGADGRCRSCPRRHARDLRRTPSRAQPVSSIPNRGRHARRRQRISQDAFHRRRARRASAKSTRPTPPI